MPAGGRAARRSRTATRVSYVVNRNINYTNVCYFHCRFCAFSKGKLAEDLRGVPYELDLEEIARRTREAWQRGATEICLQGGIHPDYTGADLSRHLPGGQSGGAGHPRARLLALEVWQGAQDARDAAAANSSAELQGAGLGSLPGTAAEILDDEVRSVICPDKIDTAQWLEVMETAPTNWACAAPRPSCSVTSTSRGTGPGTCCASARCRRETGGFTEFVPLPFVHMEAPIYLKGGARRVRPGARRS